MDTRAALQGDRTFTHCVKGLGGKRKEVQSPVSKGSYLFVKNFDLLRPDSDGFSGQPRTEGNRFLKAIHRLIREIDDAEGILDLLQILATKGEAESGRRSDSRLDGSSEEAIPEVRERMTTNQGYVTADGSSI